MASLKAKLTHVEFREDPATIQELLEMGQYPDVIARSKNVSLGEVLKLAADLGMEVSNREADLAYNPADPNTRLCILVAAIISSQRLMTLSRLNQSRGQS